MPDSMNIPAGGQADQARWVCLLGVFNLCSLVAAFTLPWLLPQKSEGFSAAAEGALLFIGAMGMALLAGVIGMILGWRWRKALASRFVALAFALLPVTLTVLGLFFAYALMRKNA